MREETDVSGSFNDDIPDGIYDFEIEKVVRKEVAGKKAYEWFLSYNGTSGKVLTWPNQIADLLPLIGAEKQPNGKYAWDTDLVTGKKFKATVSHPTTKKGKVVCTLGDFKAIKEEDDIEF